MSHTADLMLGGRMQKTTIRGGGGEDGIRVLTRQVNEIARSQGIHSQVVLSLGSTYVHLYQ